MPKLCFAEMSTFVACDGPEYCWIVSHDLNPTRHQWVRFGSENGFVWQFAHTQLVRRADNASWELHGVVIS